MWDSLSQYSSIKFEQNYQFEVACQNFSLRRSIQVELEKIIDVDFGVVNLKIEQIRLRHFCCDRGWIYRCAIAHQLAAILQISPAIVGTRLIDRLLSKTREFDRDPSQLYLNFSAAITADGWIVFYLCDRSLANWLDRLLVTIRDLKLKQSIQAKAINTFPIQYAHARCCSLLRLGNQQNLIQFEYFDRIVNGRWQAPVPIPWLDRSGKFQLIHPQEQKLFDCILIILEALEDRESKQWKERISKLSMAILEFDRDCRIHGEISRDFPQLSQARLAAIAIAQLLLKFLLENMLQTFAPEEL